MQNSLLQKIWFGGIVILATATVWVGVMNLRAESVLQKGVENVMESEQIFREQRALHCVAEPTPTEIGSVVYPISDQYSHLHFLGQIFTAAECGQDRLAEVVDAIQPEVYEDGEYGLGVNVILEGGVPSEVVQTLTSRGFQCVDLQCQYEDTIQVNTLVELKEYAHYFERDDCIRCG